MKSAWALHHNRTAQAEQRKRIFASPTLTKCGRASSNDSTQMRQEGFEGPGGSGSGCHEDIHGSRHRQIEASGLLDGSVAH